MASNGTNRWFRGQTTETKSSAEELFVFGYSCKVFRDDEKATFIDQGKHLIPWMGDESLMIDRYDVRGYLHDLTPFEAKTGQNMEKSEEEKLIDEERYLALRTDLTEEELYHEEELKRLRAALASDGAYHEISFSYDSIEDPNAHNEQNAIKEEEPEDEPYSPPTGLNVPKGMHVPSNMKIHAIIEKTALFVSQQGGQMEIIIKMKQSDNPQFAFMHIDNPLHPYYRHILQEIKLGSYKPVLVKKEVSEPDDDHHDGHYLHPSLSGTAANVPKFSVPTINFRRTGDDSYSLLVRNLKQRIEDDAQRNSPTFQAEVAEKQEDDSNAVEGNERNQDASPSDSDDSSSSESEESDPDAIIPPPPDVKPVIDKMAEFVAKNGEDFETIVKSKNDKRFAFLKQGHKFYNYYVFRRNFLIEQTSAAKEKEGNASEPTTEQHLPSGVATNNCDQPLNSGEQVNSGEQEEISESKEASLPSTNPDQLGQDEPPVAETTVKTKSDAIKPKPHPKVIKGPICFTLKPKETDTAHVEMSKKTSLLLDDSDEEDEQSSELNANASADKKTRTSGTQKVHASNHPETEEKSRKLTSEAMEAKLAEDRIKDKLAAAARERLAQQKKDKLLQFERKQKAALFLKMLQKKSAEDAAAIEKSKPIFDIPDKKSEKISSLAIPEKDSSPNMYVSPCSSPSTISIANQDIFPLSSSSSSSSSDSEAPISDKDGEDDSDNDILPQVSSSQDFLKKKLSKAKRSRSHKKRSKSHKHSRSKRRKRSKSPSPNSKRIKKSKSSSKKGKKLPAAYSKRQQPRSKSRSPPRFGRPRSRSPVHFNRWR